MLDKLVVKSASQHNLKDVSCELPRNRLVVITGPSGSGKSSLAFDTIYAEGQRRYVESLSAYARQFLDQLPKPRVESIEGLSPAIAIEQRALGKSPRSTVGTVTEIADYLRLLFARVGVPHCPISGKVLRAYTVQEIVDAVVARGEGARAAILAPVVRKRKGELRAELEQLRRDGFVRARVDGTQVDLGEELDLDRNKAHDLDVVVDRIVVKAGVKGRVTDSVELALKLGDGTVLIDPVDGSEPVVMSERLVSWEHGITLPPLEPRLFSFNSPHGACPVCDGLGMRSAIDPARIVPDDTRTLREGAVAAFGRRGSVATATEVAALVEALGVSPDKPWKDLPDEQRQAILFGSGGKAKRKGSSYEGIVARLERMLETGELEDQEDHDDYEGAIGPEDLGRFVVSQVCAECQGRRLRPEALSVKLGGRAISEVSTLPLRKLKDFLNELSESESMVGRDAAIAKPLLKAVIERTGFLIDVGLDYLTLDRPAHTLSGGEGQRIRLATQIGASLVGVLYVLDEPSVGLHARDNERLLLAVRRLVEKGNSVIVVEHDRDAILAADYVVDMGPGAGAHGGTIVATGTPADLMQNPASVTGPYLSGEKRLPLPKVRVKPGKKKLCVVGARAHNLRDVKLEIPLGCITAVTGVSGSGKSSLIVDTLLSAARAELYGATGWVGPCDRIEGLGQIDKVISIDQAPIGRTPRSNPATYTGIFTHLREVYAGLPDARARGYKPGRFSFNVKGGRCEACQGDGVLRIEMHFLPDVYVTCDACGGRRYNRETLEIRYRGMSIADALDLTVDEAFDLFESLPRIAQRLSALRQVGLGYVQLGQPATTLSGGEAQRVKLATELARKATGSTLYVLDEPTTGLHFQDIELLTHALTGLRDAGNSIVLIEHNMDLVACADWVVDLGPEGGEGGGRIVAEGTPEEVSEAVDSHTGRYLGEVLRRDARPAQKPQPAPAASARRGARGR
ncbi:MAG: excinuclease ABC subunit UvrA [Polyangiaceae bacterium]|nr:excinuclease ABC subunit UvrA [Polyangiaceae bacterium]MCE7892447.1 excinuclease ABC subunit UvrA [Sorangiineae bacterium PRO1]MCL4753161.1 excinuclease ABC subunit UvrA [Myxococcales bacterium]